MMMIEIGRYTSGRIAVANLSASIATLEVTRAGAHCFDDLLALSKLLFLRGDLLGRIADHDRGELVANEAVASSCDTGSALYLRAQLAGRFHRFAEADQLLDQLLTTDYSKQEIETERASLFQATGKYRQALALREKLAEEDPGIDTIGALASLFSEMDQWPRAEVCYAAALAADYGTSPIPCGQLLFE
jgi:tetratricopeptide (TPR) repeat protein